MRSWLVVAGGVILLGVSILRGESRAASAWPAPATAQLVLDVRDALGCAIPAHVRVAPRQLVERMRLGLLEDRSRSLPAAPSVLELMPGEYSVVISRGPEWSIAAFELRADAGSRSAHSITLVHEVQLPGWLGADLHVHTEHSPDAAQHGGVTGEDLQAEGLDVAVATDHNRIGDLGDAIESLAGAEVTTWQPEIGHFNAFPLQQLPAWRRTSPQALIAELTRDPRTFVQINHPRLESHIGYFELGGFDGERFDRPDYHLDVHGLEVWNGYDIARPDRVLALLAEWRRWLAHGHRLTATGGSDSHGADRHRPGYPRSYVRARSRDELAQALKAGQAFVSNGPLLQLSIEGAGPGDALELSAVRKLAVDVSMSAASWLHVERLELWSDRGREWSSELSGSQFHAAITLDVGGASFLHLVARGGHGLEALLGRGDVVPLAFTNPIYFTRVATLAAVPARAAIAPWPRSDPTASSSRP